MAETADSQMLLHRLWEAIDNNDIENVRMSIKQRVDLKQICYSKRYNEYMCPLALACCHGHAHEEIMEELLKSGADPNQVSGWRRRPAMLFAAEKRGLTLSMMRCLISHGADVDFTDVGGATILHYLACGQFSGIRDNLLSAAKLVLNNGASVDARDEFDQTPLYLACLRGNIDHVNLFIAKGADVNINMGDRTLLRWAAGRCDIDIFNLLLNAGANRHLNPDALVNPCNQNNHVLIARILDTCEVDINMPLDRRGGITILHLSCDLDINMPLDRRGGLTILHHACRDRRITIKTVRLLLDCGADVRAVSDTGDTALHYAVWRNSCYKIRQLLSYNPPLNIRNNENQTPFLKFIHRLKDIQSAPYDVCVLIFKMFITVADGKLPADVEQELIQLRTNLSEAQRPDFEISSELSLKKICRCVIREQIRLPFGSNVCTLPIPNKLKEYLKNPELELDSIVHIQN